MTGGRRQVAGAVATVAAASATARQQLPDDLLTNPAKRTAENSPAARATGTVSVAFLQAASRDMRT